LIKSQKAYNIYMLLSFLQAIFFAMNFTVDSIYFVVTARLDPLQLVLVGTALEVAVLLFEVPTGIVADLYSRRLSAIIGFFLIGIGFIVQGTWPIFIPILAAQLIWGLGHTFTSGAVEAWVTDEIGEENAGAALLQGAQRARLGGILGIVAGTLLGLVELRLPILISGGMVILLAILLMFIMPEDHFKPARREEMHTFQNMLHTYRQGLGMLRIRPVLISILVIGFFYGLYSEGFDRLWVAVMLDKFTFPLWEPVVWFGLVSVVEQALSAGALGMVKKRLNLTGTRGLIRALFIASAALSLALGLFAFSGRLWWAIALLLIIAVLRNVIYPLHTTWVNRKLEPQVRATILSMAGQVDAIGQIAGGPGIGIMARRISMPIGILTSALLLTPALALLGRQYARNSEPGEAAKGSSEG
jgi:DHA3 family tetracycline resistance protein-like MFS transporter